EQTLVAAATSARHLGKQQAALEYWQRAIAVNPGSIEYHAQLANVYADLKEWSKALDECRLVLRRYPANIEVRIVMVRRQLENGDAKAARSEFDQRSEEHTSELQSRGHLVCRLLLEKKKKINKNV